MLLLAWRCTADAHGTEATLDRKITTFGFLFICPQCCNSLKLNLTCEHTKKKLWANFLKLLQSTFYINNGLDVKGVACSDKITEYYHLTLQFPSVLQSVLASFSSLFWFNSLQLYCFDSVSPLSSALFVPK